MCHKNGEDTIDSIALGNVFYNTENNRSTYVGWTYAEGKQRPEEGGTTIDSNAKIQIEKWYNTNFTGVNLNKMVDGKFCNDRTIQDNEIWIEKGNNQYYSGYKRLWMNCAPTLECNNKDTYTLKVGLITADEVMMAGGKNENNTQFYLYNRQNYWTMSPYGFERDYARNFYVRANDGKLPSGDPVSTGNIGLRPVINLRSDITFSSGDGTLNNPYIVAD